MAKCEVMDTFPSFLTFWMEVRDEPVDVQVEGWVSRYMTEWPELLDKQLRACWACGLEWQSVARERIFVPLPDMLLPMQIAHSNLLELCEPIYATAQGVLGFEMDAIFILYVGVSGRAGWPTNFNGKPAVLFGLETIAEYGWHFLSPISEVIAHEIGHLVHIHWRKQAQRRMGSGPWWQLYSEGFAQWCEAVILGREIWTGSLDSAGDKGWLEWCKDHKVWLANEFIRRVDAGEGTEPFFDFFSVVEGRRLCGHFLGYELMRELVPDAGLRSVALMENVDSKIRDIMERIASGED